jgi:hypothetical protein
MPNTYANRVDVNGITVIDLTQDTAVAADVAQGKYFHLASGERVAGTASGGNDFIVTLSYNDQTEMWEPDCTYAEVNAAYQAGKEIVAVTSAGWYPASCTVEDDPHFLIAYTVSVSSADSYGLPIVTQMSYVLDQNGITSDGDYVTIYPEFASPSVTYTPTTSQQTDTITFDPNSYNGIEQVSVTVNAMPSGTEGTPTATKGTVSNHAISVTPSVTNAAGYISGGTKTGTAVSVSASELVSGTYSVTSSGTHDVTNYASASVAAGGATASATKGTVSNHSVTVTPSVTRTAGYVTAGSSNGTAVTVSASELVSGTYTVDSSGTKDVTNYASASVPSGSATASATKGSVSNHSVSVTPSVTRTAGWVSAGTASGTAVTVSASELVSGSETKTENGTYDVTNLASLTVNVASGGSATYRLDNIVPEQTVACTTLLQNNAYYGFIQNGTPVDNSEQYLVTFDGTEYVCEGYVPEANCSGVGDIRVVNTNSVQYLIAPFFIEYENATSDYYFLVRGSGTHTVRVDKLTFIDDGETFTTKTITENGTYSASSDNADGYSSVTVNVSGGSSMNVQVAQSTTRVANTAYTKTASLTCAKTGTYDVYWDCFRSSTSGTSGSQLHVGGNAYGSANTTFSNHAQNNHLTGVRISAGQEVAVYVRSRATNYYAYCGQLTIVQTA